MVSAFFQRLERLIPLQGLLLLSCFGHPYALSSHLRFIWGGGFRIRHLQNQPFRVLGGRFYLHHDFSSLSKLGTTHSTPRTLTHLLLWASLCSQQPFMVHLGEGGFRMGELMGFRTSHLYRFFLGGNIPLTSSCQLSVKVWNDSAHSKGSYSSFALGILPGVTSAKQRLTGQKRTASEVPAQLRARKGTPASSTARQDNGQRREASQPQETHKEAGQQKPELPPPSL